MPNTVLFSAGIDPKSQDQIVSQLGRAIDKGLRQGFAGFKGIDDRNGTAALARLTTGARNFGTALDTTNRRVIGFGVSLGLLGGAVRTLEGLVRSTLDVDKAMARINATTALTVRQLDAVSRGLFDVARRTGESFGEIAKGYEAFSKQGGSVEQTLKRTTAAAGLAKLGNIEITESVKGLVAAYSTFGRAGETYVGIANKISAANRSFGVDVKDLIEGLGAVGPQAQDLGVPLNKLIGLITSLKTVTGRDGPAIAQSLQRIFARASESTNLNKLTGIVDNAQLKTTVQVLDEVAAKYAKLTDAQRRTVSQAFGGIFSPAQTKALLQDLSSINGISSQVARNVAQATNDLQQRLAKQNNNLAQSLANLKTSAQQAGAIIGNQTLRPALGNVFSAGNGAADLLRRFTGENPGDDLGKLIGNGILKGLGQVLGGPGLVIAFRTLAGAAKRTFPEVIRDARQAAGFLGPQSAQGQDLATINRVNSALALGTEEEQARYLAATKTSQQEAIILGILERQVQAAQRLAGLNAIAREVGATGVFGRVGRAAGGYIPAMGAEAAAIGAGVGGAPSTARAVTIPNFAYGGGVSGPIVANTSEFMVHGAGGSSIYNRDMIRQRGLPPGATPIAAGGYVPRAAGGFQFYGEDAPTISQLRAQVAARQGIGGQLPSAGPTRSGTFQREEFVSRGSFPSQQQVDSLNSLFRELNTVSGEKFKTIAASIRDIGSTLNAPAAGLVRGRLLGAQGARARGYAGGDFSGVKFVRSGGPASAEDQAAYQADFEARALHGGPARPYVPPTPFGPPNDPINTAANLYHAERDARLKKAADDAEALRLKGVAEQARQARAAGFQRFGSNLQFAGLGASLASGFISEGEGGTASGQNRGRLIGGLQGFGTGVAIGSVGGLPGEIVGGLAGLIFGAVKGAADKAKPSFDELAKSIGNVGAKNDQLASSTEQYIRGVDTLRQAEEQGASPRALAQIRQVNRDNLYAVGDSGLRRRLDAAGTNQEALLAISNDVNERRQGFANRGSAILGAAQLADHPDATDPASVSNFFANAFRGKNVNTNSLATGSTDERLDALSSALTGAGGFSVKGANQAIAQLKTLDIKTLLEFLDDLVKGISDNQALSNLSDTARPKVNLEGAVSEQLSGEIAALEKAIDEGAGLAAFIRQRASQRQGAAIRILGERRVSLKGYSQDSLGLQGAFQIDAAQQEAGAANDEAVKRTQQAFAAALQGPGGTLAFDPAQTATINKGLAGATSPDQFSALKSFFSTTEGDKLQKVIDKLQETNTNGARQIQLVTEQVQLQRLELQAEQHNAILTRGTFNPGAGAQFGTLIANGRGPNAGPYGTSLQQSELLDSLGITQGPQTAQLQEFLRRQSAGQTLASLASRRLGRRVGSDPASVAAAAQQLSQSKSTDDQELGARIQASVGAIGFNPVATVAKLSNGTATAKDVTNLVNSKQLSVGEGGVVTLQTKANSFLESIAGGIAQLVKSSPGATSNAPGSQGGPPLSVTPTTATGVPLVDDPEALAPGPDRFQGLSSSDRRTDTDIGPPLLIDGARGRLGQSGIGPFLSGGIRQPSPIPSTPAAPTTATGVAQTTIPVTSTATSAPLKVTVVDPPYVDSSPQSGLSSFGGGFTSGLESFKSNVNDLYAAGSETADKLEQHLSSAFDGFVTGAERGKRAFQGFVSSLFADESKLFSDQGFKQLFGLIGTSLMPSATTSTPVAADPEGAFDNAKGGPLGFASGGRVPVMLTGGEYVFSPGAARRIGPTALRAINSGNVKGYAAGGGVVRGGSGIRDDVPGSLPQGSFVVKKSSVNRLGASYLNAMARGGYSSHDDGDFIDTDYGADDGDGIGLGSVGSSADSGIGNALGSFFGGQDVGGFGLPGALIGGIIGLIADRKNRAQGALVGAGIGLGAGLLANTVNGNNILGPQNNASPVNTAKTKLNQFLSSKEGGQLTEKFGAAGVLGGISYAASPHYKSLDYNGIRNNAVALENEQQGVINNRAPGTFIDLQQGRNGQFNIIDAGGPNGNAYGNPAANEFSPYGYDSGGTVGAPDVGYTPVGAGGAGSTPVQNTITIHNYGGGQTSTSATSSGGGGGNPLGNQDFAKLLSRYVNAAVQDQLVQSRRPGSAAQTFQRYSPTYGS